MPGEVAPDATPFGFYIVSEVYSLRRNKSLWREYLLLCCSTRAFLRPQYEGKHGLAPFSYDRYYDTSFRGTAIIFSVIKVFQIEGRIAS